MGFLRSGGGNHAWIPLYTGLQIQTSSNAVPIQIVYGTNRTAPNALWTGGFFAIAQYQKSGGKGGSTPVSGYNYYTSFELGVCEGPIAGYRSFFASQQEFLSLSWTGLQFETFGTQSQAPWGFLSTNYSTTTPRQDLNYKGLAYVAAANFPLGNSPVLPQFSFEVQGRLLSSAVLNGYDADPALIIQDFLTNSQYGVGFPAASIDARTLLGSSGDSSYQTYCQATYFALSPVLSNQEAANSILARWLQLTNTAAVWSGGKLKFIPYGDSPVTGRTTSGSVTFNPNVTPVYNLADDDFVFEDGKDPVECVRNDPYEIYNWQRLQICQRSNYYDTTPIDAWDQNAIELYGLRMASDITANEICDPIVAQTSAQLILQRALYIRNTYNFKLSFEYCLLEPMDLVTVTDTGLGLSNVAVRITSIEEGDAGLLAVTAEEFPGGTATAVQYPVQGKTSNSTNQNVVPARVNAPMIFEPPSNLTGGVAQVYIAASGGSAPVYTLEEDSSTGPHNTYHRLVSSQASGTAITLSVYAQAITRTKCAVQIFDGSAYQACLFDLSGVTATRTTGGITASSIAASGGGWYQLSITANMAATANPILVVALTNTSGALSYAGTSGDGIYIWGAEFSAGTKPPTFLPAFSTTTGATLATSGVATPEGVSGVGDPNWGGANVWLSTDGNTYGQVGQITAPARQGVLTASFGTSSANPDITNDLFVSLAESGGQLASGTVSDAQNGVTLCLVDNELLAYETATLQTPPPPNAYELQYLYRGLYGTTVTSHSSGAPFVRVDSAVFQYPLPAAFIGVTIYLKLQSFNIFGQAVEDLSECAVYTYTPTGAGQPLGSVSQALAVGTNLDYGLASAGVNESDDWGLASTHAAVTIELGLASS